MEESAQKLTLALAAKSRSRGRNARQMQASLDNMRKEAVDLQQTLIAVRVSGMRACVYVFTSICILHKKISGCLHQSRMLTILDSHFIFTPFFVFFRRIPGNVCDKHWTGPGARWAMMSRSIRKS
jgi:hypothetical protein